MANRALSAWFWTALLLILCLLPRNITPDESSASISARVPHADKIVHFTLFVGFGLLWTHTLGPGRRWPTVLLAGVLLAAGTELAQGLPAIDRDPDLLDGVADAAGVVGGLVGYRLFARAAVPEGVAP